MNMKEKSIICNAENVYAILAGKKTQTRRVVKNAPADMNAGIYPAWPEHDGLPPSQYGYPGDRLWVRETFSPDYFGIHRPGYKADWGRTAAEYIPEPKWRPSIHMPRWASRITLEIMQVRVERLQDITDNDVYAEGIPSTASDMMGEACLDFRAAWDTIYSKLGFPWASNPFVWVIEFRRL